MIVRDAQRRPGRRFSLLHSPFKFRAINPETGEFSGWASIFDTLDAYETIFDRGCFADSLAEWRANGSMPRMLWQHDWWEVIGRWLVMEERDQGLWAEGRLELRTQRGAEAAALLAAEPHPALDHLSIGFLPIGFEKDADGRWHYTKVYLGEASLVTFGGMPGARVQRALDPDAVQTERDLEDALRDAGFSRSEAVAVASRFTPKSQAPRDAATVDIGPFRALLDDIRRASSV